MKQSFLNTAATLALGGAMWVTPALADFTFNGDTTGQPTWQRPFTFIALSGVGTAVNFQTIQITMANAATFLAETTLLTHPDTYLHMYQGAFDPNDQFTNLVALDDDGGVGFASAISEASDGPFADDTQYTLVVSGFEDGQFGTYILDVIGAVLGWGPATLVQLDEVLAVMADTGRNDLNQTSGNIRDAAGDSFASRDAISFSTKGAGGLMGDVYAWVKGSVLYQRETSLGRSYRAPLLQFGADVAIGHNLVAGLALSTGDLNVQSPDFSFDGSQVLVQPYASWRHDDWHGTAMVTYGMIDYNTITSVSGVAGVEGELLGFSADIGRDFDLGNGATTLTPFVGVDVGSVELTADSGTLATLGVGSSVNFTELSLGAEMAHRFENGTFTFGISADHYDTDAPTALFGGTYDTTGWSGTTRFDYTVNLSQNTVLGAGVKLGGIGTSNLSYTGNLSLQMQF